MWNTLNTLNSLVSEGVKELASEVRQGVAQVSKRVDWTSSSVCASTHSYAPTSDASKYIGQYYAKYDMKAQSLLKVEICAFCTPKDPWRAILFARGPNTISHAHCWGMGSLLSVLLNQVQWSNVAPFGPSRCMIDASFDDALWSPGPHCQTVGIYCNICT